MVLVLLDDDHINLPIGRGALAHKAQDDGIVESGVDGIPHKPLERAIEVVNLFREAALEGLLMCH